MSGVVCVVCPFAGDEELKKHSIISIRSYSPQYPRSVASEHPFCALRYMNFYVFHIYFILFFPLSNTHLIFDFICLTLALADRRGIAKYARTYIRQYTRTHAPKKKK